MVNGHPGEFATNRYFDRGLEIEAVKLLPGEYHATGEDIVQVTVLGSCVSACIRDRDRGVGGMNHFMLPDGAEGAMGNSSRYGVNAMEVLINELAKLGARRDGLEAKVFGGGSVLRGFTVSNVGQRNAEFVVEFLRTERIPIVARDLEDVYPRKVYFFPRTGRARIKKLMTMHNRTLLDRELGYRQQLTQVEQKGGDIELFG